MYQRVNQAGATTVFTLMIQLAFSQPASQLGVMNANLFDFEHNRLELSGTWLWHDNQLYSPQEAWARNGDAVDFPKTWNEVRSSQSGQGFATYMLTVLVADKPTELALEIPQIYSSYRIWINNELIASNGVPGKTKEETTPQWLPQTVTFENASDSLRIVLQIANFHHYKGGCKDPIYLGASASLMNARSLSTASKIIECSVLFIVSLVFFIIYFLHGRKKVVIYFSLLCLTWSIRSIFSNEYTFISFFPDFDWALMVRIEYLTLYFTMMWAILYMSRLFTGEGNQIFKYLLTTANGVFAAYTVFTDPLAFTRLLPVYLVTSAILLLYGSGVILVALINERIGATFLTISAMLGIVIFSYDIFTYEGFFSYNSLVFSAGYITIFSLMGIALLLHLEIIKSTPKPTTMLTYKDLYKDN